MLAVAPACIESCAEDFMDVAVVPSTVTSSPFADNCCWPSIDSCCCASIFIVLAFNSSWLLASTLISFDFILIYASEVISISLFDTIFIAV